MRLTKLAGLEVRIAGGDDREGGGEGPVVVLMHGFGAPGDDLTSLWRVIDVPRAVRFVFPAAPLSPPEFAAFGGRAWWPIDLAAMQRGDARDRSREAPSGLAPAHGHVAALLDELERELHVGGERIVLGGFSQGAMLACDVALRSERKLAGLVLLSTTLLCRGDWQPRMALRKALPVLQTHGRNDAVLPFAAATTLRDLFRAEGCSVDWHEFGGGHEIPQAVLDALGRFVQKHG
jgi:phospholipase/carboxylesterase